MRYPPRFRRLCIPPLLVACLPLLFLTPAGCNEPVATTLGVATGATLLGGQSPSQEIEQVYYLGVFDPQEQVPEAVYRITVRGQASVLSFMRFASGWAPAQLVDSLNTNVGFADKSATRPSFDKGEDADRVNLRVGRRLVLFGPEGFRVAPKDYRLVIVMGSSPEDFFNAMELSLGAMANAQRQRLDPTLDKSVFDSLAATKSEREKLSNLKTEVDSELAN